MNRYINALITKHKKKHLPSFLQGTWFDEWMSYGYITFITSFIPQGMLYANWRDYVIQKLAKRGDVNVVVNSGTIEESVEQVMRVIK